MSAGDQPSETQSEASLAPASGRPTRGKPSWSRLSWERLQRPGRGFIPLVDGLRFYAIGSVVLWHVYYQLADASWLTDTVLDGAAVRRAMQLGKRGVELFFVISGFVLALPHARHAFGGPAPHPLGRYYLRRLTRLEPPFLLALGVAFALKAWILGQPGLWPHLLASALYVHGPVFGQPSLVSGVTWSLEVEVQFYVLLPLLARAFRLAPRQRRALAAAVLVALAVLRPLWTLPGVAWLGPYLDYFVVGMVLADLFASGEQRPARPAAWAWDVATGALLGLVALAAWPWQRGDVGQLMGPALLPCLLGLTVAAATRGPLARWLTTRPLIFVLGGMCYTLYLFHNIILRGVVRNTSLVPDALDTLGPHLGLAATVLTLLVAVVIPCVALYVTVERPCMASRWPRSTR